ncbi:PQQ-dependent sugar dehydrogenase [Hyalangium rubrum]|uniref:PQQ-dependent sugar dehydrogenase n=1 Tax=Hyalangium rubrum TaxID=3103134 RepID=A0ABU5HEE1_9BACT|nr:PQQ-dependent sugar dehydrogenase [Hyalangium sp. s54d21]MDY7231845.1 PQQ-dependent sugar dehydrogenase [Hyalangium sp. s54d21]
MLTPRFEEKAFATLLALVGLLALVPGTALATVSERGFTEQVFVEGGLSELTAMAWAPDGSNRLFITRKRGEIRVVKNGELLSTPWATVSPLRTSGESGLIGLAFDPHFATNRYVYVVATVFVNEGTVDQQILRYTDVEGVGTDRTVILAGLPTGGGNHNGGGLAFGPDGMLYFGVGDGFSPVGVEDLSSLVAKIGRTRTDGTAPEDNPFFDGPGPNNDYIWARGFRNPFGLAFQPGTGKLWVDVAGDLYEQVFAVQGGDHAGWPRYEANQPPEFLAPVIRYGTNHAPQLIADRMRAVRRDGIATFTLEAPHHLRPGERITISQVGDASFHGDGDVASVPTPETFTVVQPGPDVWSNRGVLTLQNLGGSVTGGAFYQGTAFPPAYRGNFFFGDFNSDSILRAVIDAQGTVTRVEPWAQGVSGAVSVAVGPDGALYYASFYTGHIYRTSYTAPLPRLRVSTERIDVQEGQTASFTVRMEEAPAAPVTITVWPPSSPDRELSVVQGSDLTFTPDNHATPQTATFAAGEDADALHDSVSFFIGGPGVEPREVTVRTLDDDGVDLVLSSTTVNMREGGQSLVVVSLASPPPTTVVAHATVVGEGLEIVEGTFLTFSPTNHSQGQYLVIGGVGDTNVRDGSATVQLIGAGLRLGSIAVTLEDRGEAAPVFISAPVTTAATGVEYRYALEARSHSGARYALDEGPEGMSLDEETGVLSWTPLEQDTHEITVRAFNGGGLDALQGFTLAVLASPEDAGTPDGGSPDGGPPQDGGTGQPQPDAGVEVPPSEPDTRCGCSMGSPVGGLLLAGVLLSLLTQARSILGA